MLLKSERVAIGTRKASAMPWFVCRNVAYPPSWCLFGGLGQVAAPVGEAEGQRMRGASPLPFGVI